MFADDIICAAVDRPHTTFFSAGEAVRVSWRMWCGNVEITQEQINRFRIESRTWLPGFPRPPNSKQHIPGRALGDVCVVRACQTLQPFLARLSVHRLLIFGKTPIYFSHNRALSVSIRSKTPRKSKIVCFANDLKTLSRVKNCFRLVWFYINKGTCCVSTSYRTYISHCPC